MIGQGMHGFVENKELEIDDIDAALREPTDKRVFVISKAMHKGYTVDQIHDLTKIDKWFLEKLKHIIDIDEAMKKCNINTLDQDCSAPLRFTVLPTSRLLVPWAWSRSWATCTRQPCWFAISARAMASCL